MPKYTTKPQGYDVAINDEELLAYIMEALKSNRADLARNGILAAHALLDFELMDLALADWELDDLHQEINTHINSECEEQDIPLFPGLFLPGLSSKSSNCDIPGYKHLDVGVGPRILKEELNKLPAPYYIKSGVCVTFDFEGNDHVPGGKCMIRYDGRKNIKLNEEFAGGASEHKINFCAIETDDGVLFYEIWWVNNIESLNKAFEEARNKQKGTKNT